MHQGCPAGNNDRGQRRKSVAGAIPSSAPGPERCASAAGRSRDFQPSGRTCRTFPAPDGAVACSELRNCASRLQPPAPRRPRSPLREKCPPVPGAPGSPGEDGPFGTGWPTVSASGPAVAANKPATSLRSSFSNSTLRLASPASSSVLRCSNSSSRRDRASWTARPRSRRSEGGRSRNVAVIPASSLLFPNASGSTARKSATERAPSMRARPRSRAS